MNYVACHDSSAQSPSTSCEVICRYNTVDEQLYKDVEGVFEAVCEALAALHKQGCTSMSEKHIIFKELLELWDSICVCWQSKPKPGSWITCLLKTAKLFSPQCRHEAALSAQASYAAQQFQDESWMPNAICNQAHLWLSAFQSITH